MFGDGELVELVEALSAYGLRRGEVGTVLGLRDDHRTYRVAFIREGGAIGTYDVPYIALRRAGSDVPDADPPR